MALWLSRSFGFPGLSMVKNISKIFWAFKCPKLLQNLPKILPKMLTKIRFNKKTWNLECFESFKNNQKYQKLMVSVKKCSKNVQKILKNFKNWWYPLKISPKILINFKNCLYFQTYFWTFSETSQFLVSVLTVKRDQNFCLFLRKAVKFRENPPEFKTLSGTHGLSFKLSDHIWNISEK